MSQYLSTIYYYFFSNLLSRTLIIFLQKLMSQHEWHTPINTVTHVTVFITIFYYLYHLFGISSNILVI